MREAEVGLRSTDTIKFYFRKHSRTFEREAFALKIGDRGTKNSLPRKSFTHQREGCSIMSAVVRLRDRFLASVFGLTGESKRNLINVLK